MQDKTFIKTVLVHYRKNGRHTLPWRKNITPYRIVVSEIMLQQTQVSRVLEKYSLWMKSYPTLKALSQASFRDVLVLWQGLGYQRRAKALYELAQKHTRVPVSYDELCTLSGIGTYTASAISAFAYDTFSHPLLETNIRTALIETYHQGEEKIHDGILYDDLSRLEKSAQVKKLGARIWYYALMDYGAHLKASSISHNAKSVHHVKQSVYKGSVRELRAKVLFAITHGETSPDDERTEGVLEKLVKEGYVIKKGKRYRISS
ncbi:MAG: A/G-specific adenine glycosylase [Candidatus Paceibacterota bacterium]